MAVEVLGIRHHGVGSAINVKARLEEIMPDYIIVEAPIELMDSLDKSDLENFTPPVAILSYNPDDLAQSVYYPFSSFSPEWQTFLYAQKHKIPYSTADLPLKFSFGLENKEIKEEKIEETREIHANPLEEFAKLSDYVSAEAWWDDNFEERRYSNASLHFEAVLALMTTIREHFIHRDFYHNERREAFMREAIREAIKKGYEKIVFVCGAWHAPALLTYKERKKEDRLLLKKLPKTKVESSWIPWLNSRLSWDSGYGAGIDSAGWYEHLWAYPDDEGERWLVYVAEVFRKNGFDISSSHTIETFRLAQTLAIIRGLSRIGLREMNDAIVSVMCMGDKIQLDFIEKELIVGSRMGSVPLGVTQLPIKKDFDAKVKSYRLQIREDEKSYTLDLRTPAGLKKSIFFHRLRLLDIGWNHLEKSRSKGSFKEVWSLKWRPEIELAIIDKAIWGNSIALASQNYIINLATNSEDSVEVVKLIHEVLLAELFTKIDFLIDKIERLMVDTQDVLAMIKTMIPLIKLLRYDNVRKIDKNILLHLIDLIFSKIIIHLKQACFHLNEHSAKEMAKNIMYLHQELLLLKEEEKVSIWLKSLADIVDEHDVSSLIQGLLTRILFDSHFINNSGLKQAFFKAFSLCNDRINSAFWLEGFLDENVMIIVLDDTIWAIVYQWLASLEEKEFDMLLPILRRTFSHYSHEVRAKISKRVKKGMVSTKEVKNLMRKDNFNGKRALFALKNLKSLWV